MAVQNKVEKTENIMYINCCYKQDAIKKSHLMVHHLVYYYCYKQVFINTRSTLNRSTVELKWMHTK